MRLNVLNVLWVDFVYPRVSSRMLTFHNLPFTEYYTTCLRVLYKIYRQIVFFLYCEYVWMRHIIMFASQQTYYMLSAYTDIAERRAAEEMRERKKNCGIFCLIKAIKCIQRDKRLTHSRQGCGLILGCSSYAVCYLFRSLSHTSTNQQRALAQHFGIGILFCC